MVIRYFAQACLSILIISCSGFMIFDPFLLFTQAFCTLAEPELSKYKIYINPPYEKWDMNSHGNSMSFYVTSQRHFGQNWHQIPWLFHVSYPGFICLPCAKTWHGFWTSSSHGISMVFAKEMMGFTLYFDQIVVKKTWENPCHIFYRVINYYTTIWNWVHYLISHMSSFP